MKTVKRLGLVALLAVGVTLLANTPARAADTYELINTSVEPDASGTVTYNWNANSLTVKCAGLRPLSPYGVGYLVVFRVSGGGTYFESEDYESQCIETDKKGTLTFKVPIYSSQSYGMFSSSTYRRFSCVSNDSDVLLY